MSGASGMLLPRHMLAALIGLEEVERVHLVVSRGASQVLKHELGETKTGAADLASAAGVEAGEKLAIHRDNELDAPIASGSYRLTGTAIVPCSAGTLGALATGLARTLVHRAGAVALKEGWPLVLGFRETPMSVVHLENLRRLAYQGAVALPPVPAFYIDSNQGVDETETLERFAAHYVMRVLDRLGLSHGEEVEKLRWKSGSPA